MLELDFLEVFYGEDKATNYRAILFRLIAKADWENVERIRAGYPVEVALYEWWMATSPAPSEDEISKKARALELAGGRRES